MDRRRRGRTAVSDPVLVEVTRGRLVESRHRGAIVVVDAGGRRRAAVGDVGQAVFPRSAVKALQALPLVESGAADAYGFGNAVCVAIDMQRNGFMTGMRREIERLYGGPEPQAEAVAG